MFRFSLLLFALFSFLQTKAQIQSGAYSVMLSALLSHSVPEISVEQLTQKNVVLLLDAREADEYSISRIKGATHVGYEHFDISALRHVSKEQDIVVYCSVGYRSEKIGEKLRLAGFKNVSNLYGGIFEWINQGHVVVDTNNQPTQYVHAYSTTWGIWLNEGIKVYGTP